MGTHQNSSKRLDTMTSNNVEVTIACAVNALNIYYILVTLNGNRGKRTKEKQICNSGAGGTTLCITMTLKC